jgi:hypothetical protein
VVGTLDWVTVRPNELHCDFVGPASGKVAVCVTYGVNTGGRAWAAARDLNSGHILDGSGVLLAQQLSLKGPLTFDLVPLHVQPGRNYRIALAVKTHSLTQRLELAAGPRHPTGLIEVYQ